MIAGKSWVTGIELFLTFMLLNAPKLLKLDKEIVEGNSGIVLIVFMRRVHRNEHF